MSKRHGGNNQAGPPDDENREPAVAAKRSTWHAGHVPHIPRDGSDEEPDWVTGWLHERLLDGMSESPEGEKL